MIADIWWVSNEALWDSAPLKLLVAGGNLSLVSSPNLVQELAALQGLDIHAATFIQDGFRYAHYPNVDIGKHQLSDFDANPAERNNLWSQRPDRVNEMAREIDAHEEAREIDREWLAQDLQNPAEETLEGLKRGNQTREPCRFATISTMRVRPWRARQGTRQLRGRVTPWTS